jgi:hypothetical protein
MRSSADRHPDVVVRARLIGELSRRLQAAQELAVTARECLTAADVDGIEAATARLETVAQEFKLLAEEYDRLPALDPELVASGAVAVERAALEAAAKEIARSSAISGGLLERMVSVSRRLLRLIGAAKDGTYESTGRAPEFAPNGVQLKEWV